VPSSEAGPGRHRMARHRHQTAQDEATHADFLEYVLAAENQA
jgi:hypothetical protein